MRRQPKKRCQSDDGDDDHALTGSDASGQENVSAIYLCETHTHSAYNLWTVDHSIYNNCY